MHFLPDSSFNIHIVNPEDQSHFTGTNSESYLLIWLHWKTFQIKAVSGSKYRADIIFFCLVEAISWRIIEKYYKSNENIIWGNCNSAITTCWFSISSVWGVQINPISQIFCSIYYTLMLSFPGVEGSINCILVHRLHGVIFFMLKSMSCAIIPFWKQL